MQRAQSVVEYGLLMGAASLCAVAGAQIYGFAVYQWLAAIILRLTNLP